RRVELNFACARRSGVEHVAAQRLAPPLRTGTRFGGGPRAVVIVLLEREVHALPGDPVTLRVQCGEKIETLEQDRPLLRHRPGVARLAVGVTAEAVLQRGPRATRPGGRAAIQRAVMVVHQVPGARLDRLLELRA